MPKTKVYDISPDVVRSILKDAGVKPDVVSRAIGYAPSHIASCCSERRMTERTMIAVKAVFDIDLKPAIVEEPQELVLVNESPDKMIQKFIDDYSYARSNDADRIIRAINNLTDVVEALINKLG